MGGWRAEKSAIEGGVPAELESHIVVTGSLENAEAGEPIYTDI